MQTSCDQRPWEIRGHASCLPAMHRLDPPVLIIREADSGKQPQIQISEGHESKGQCCRYPSLTSKDLICQGKAHSVRSRVLLWQCH